MEELSKAIQTVEGSAKVSIEVFTCWYDSVYSLGFILGLYDVRSQWHVLFLIIKQNFGHFGLVV
jgi:hypothetical protein